MGGLEDERYRCGRGRFFYSRQSPGPAAASGRRRPGTATTGSGTGTGTGSPPRTASVSFVSRPCIFSTMVQFPCGAAAALVFFSSLHTALAQWDTLCPGASGKWGAWNESRCDSATQTCCPSGFSPSGVGCCPFKNAVCCPGSQFACCPEGSTCKLAAGSGYDSRYNCTPADPSLPPTVNAATCKGGPIQPLSATKKNVVWIGDSLSLGMMPHVAQNLSDIAFVQHAPWGGDGGAEETTYGLRCLANYLHSPSGMPLNKLDLVLFNFGMVRFL